LEVQWPDVALEQLQHVEQLSSQLTGLTVLASERNGDVTRFSPKLQWLTRFTALQELHVARADSLGWLTVKDTILEQWEHSMQHLTSLQLPNTEVDSHTLLPLYLGHMQHVSLHSICSLKAFAHCQCNWQVVHLRCVGVKQLCCLPPLHGLTRPLSIECLWLSLSDHRLLKTAIARVDECCKAGLGVQQLNLAVDGRDDSTAAQEHFMKDAAPLLQALVAGSTLSALGDVRSAALTGLEACGVQHCIVQLDINCNFVPAPCFWEAAPQVLAEVEKVTLSMWHFNHRSTGTRCIHDDVLQWLQGTAWASIVAYLRAIPRHVEVVVQFWCHGVMHAAAPIMQEALQGAAQVRIVFKPQV
jgi:hypothetical protein